MVTLWVAALAISILLYVLLDGSVLGVGMLLGLRPNEKSRQIMLGAVAPVRGGSEIWLIATGFVLWAAFPIAYAMLCSACCVPVLVMLAGLILRSISFELCYRAQRVRWIWDAVFCGGCLIATFMQGMMLGALVEGLLDSGRYFGTERGCLSPFAVLCGVGLCFGYALLGACWLFQKCEGDVREQTRQVLPSLAGGLFAFFIFLFLYALVDLQVLGRWLERPYLFVIPAAGVVTAFLLAVTARHERRRQPLLMALSIFVSGFGTLAVSFWPYMIPFAVTVDDAAAPLSKLTFMFWVGINVLPPVLVFALTNHVGFDVARYRIIPNNRASAFPATSEKRNEFPPRDN